MRSNDACNVSCWTPADQGFLTVPCAIGWRPPKTLASPPEKHDASNDLLRGAAENVGATAQNVRATEGRGGSERQMIARRPTGVDETTERRHG
jgi:hypothetical protein